MELGEELHHRLRQIKLLVLDCDGVLTDGRISLLPEGDELKTYDVRDGHGLRLAMQAGLRTAIITGRQSQLLARRAAELGIHHLHQKIGHKVAPFEAILREEQLPASAAAYVGDDLPDIPVLRRAGLAVAVADAAPETKQVAHYVTKQPGGHGAVRELVELILRTQGRWEALVSHYFVE